MPRISRRHSGFGLAGKLQDLGFGVERKRDDFEIAGIPADVLKRFSRRTALIEKVAGRTGHHRSQSQGGTRGRDPREEGFRDQVGKLTQGMERAA